MKLKSLVFALFFLAYTAMTSTARAGCTEVFKRLLSWVHPSQKKLSLTPIKHNLFARPIVTNRRKGQVNDHHFRQKEIPIDTFPHEIAQKIKETALLSEAVKANVSFLVVLDRSGEWKVSEVWIPGISFSQKFANFTGAQKYSISTEFLLKPQAIFEFEFSNRSHSTPSWIGPWDIDYAIDSFNKYQDLGFKGAYHYFLTPNVFTQQGELLFSPSLQHYFERLDDHEGVIINALNFKNQKATPIVRQNNRPFVLGISMDAKQLKHSVSVLTLKNRILK